MQTIHPSDWNFRFRSGRLCLDFIATVGDRDHLSFDRWRGLEDFGRWCVAAGLLSNPVEVTAAELDDARRLRETLYRLVDAVLAGSAADPADLALLNETARKAPLVPQLAALGEPGSWHADAPFEAVLATVARDAIDLLSGHLTKRLRKCADDHCSVLFVDMSRPGKRRWCAMNGCGNKVKKATYRKRLRA
ncbi:MAG: CGNR zinc finger domain-containing protein [Pseudomonadota bacterium]